MWKKTQLRRKNSANYLEKHRQAIVRNGHLPERQVQTGIGDVAVQVPKVRDRSGSGIRFNSTLLPPYLKRAKSLASRGMGGNLQRFTQSWNERVWSPPLLQALCLIAIRYDCLRVSGLSNDAVFVGIGP